MDLGLTNFRCCLREASEACPTDEELCELISKIYEATEQANLAFSSDDSERSSQAYHTVLCHTQVLAKLAVKRVVCQGIEASKHILRLLLHLIYCDEDWGTGTFVCTTLIQQGQWILYTS